MTPPALRLPAASAPANTITPERAAGGRRIAHSAASRVGQTMPDYDSRGGTGAWRRAREFYARALPLPCSVCQLPVRPDQRWHLDHVVPRARGGGMGALWPAHAACNLAKKDRLYTTPVYVDPSA